MKHKIGIILSVIALLLSIMTAGCGHPTTTTTETEFNDVNSVSTKSGNGLSLSVSLDAKTYQSSDAINIVITEYNTLSKTNKRLAADKWPIKGLSDSVCGVEDFPFGIAVFQGDYTADNISTGTPLILYNPNVIILGCVPNVQNVTAYNFQRSSDTATISGDLIYGNATFDMSSTIPLSEHWTGTYPDTIRQNLGPGIYTVVGGDEWGALVILHFTVTS
jgi:hypothetical protein